MHLHLFIKISLKNNLRESKIIISGAEYNIGDVLARFGCAISDRYSHKKWLVLLIASHFYCSPENDSFIIYFTYCRFQKDNPLFEFSKLETIKVKIRKFAQWVVNFFYIVLWYLRVQ